MCYLTAREEYDQLEQQCTLPMSWEGDFCRPVISAQQRSSRAEGKRHTWAEGDEGEGPEYRLPI